MGILLDNIRETASTATAMADLLGERIGVVVDGEVFVSSNVLSSMISQFAEAGARGAEVTGLSVAASVSALLLSAEQQVRAS